MSEILAASNNPDQTQLDVRQALDRNDPDFAPAFWDAFRQTIDSENWIKSYYVLESVSESDGLVRVHPSQMGLKVTREQGQWKFGFSESFQAQN